MTGTKPDFRYRGLSAEGKWVYGGVVDDINDKTYIIEILNGEPCFTPVDRDTVGKALANDKAGCTMFLGDLVECDKYDGVFEICYSQSEAMYVLAHVEEDYIITFDNVWAHDCTVVGNRFKTEREGSYGERE